MKLIVSVDNNWGIGKNGQLLARVPDDLRRFKQLTLGQPVILGQLTLETFPNAQPLPGRDNIILSDDPAFACPGAQVVRSLPQLLQLVARDYAQADPWVIGGASVYAQLLPYCHAAYITRWYADLDADRFLPNLDEMQWELVEQSQRFDYQGLEFAYLTYANPDVQV